MNINAASFGEQKVRFSGKINKFSIRGNVACLFINEWYSRKPKLLIISLIWKIQPFASKRIENEYLSKFNEYGISGIFRLPRLSWREINTTIVIPAFVYKLKSHFCLDDWNAAASFLWKAWLFFGKNQTIYTFWLYRFTKTAMPRHSPSTKSLTDVLQIEDWQLRSKERNREGCFEKSRVWFSWRFWKVCVFDKICVPSLRCHNSNAKLNNWVAFFK